MFNRKVVQKALKETWALDGDSRCNSSKPADDKSRLTSHLIYDIFGGEILKTHKKEGWYFYNRINGERVDFTGSEPDKLSETYRFGDIPSAPDETYNYFAPEDYSTFYMRFVRTFEEAVGLEKYRPGCTA
jgi:hypothetical protein